jgi:DNA-directed RNA polymerase specialized sigma24 family protein
MIADPLEHQVEGQSIAQACAELYRLHHGGLIRQAGLRGWDEHEAWDLVQELFLRLFKSGMIGRVAALPEGGQRAWLLQTLSWMSGNLRRSRYTRRRGDGQVPQSLDLLLQEGFDPAGVGTPESAHDRAWAMAVLSRSMHRLRATVSHQQWHRLEASLVSPAPGERPAAAERVALYRARGRLRQFIAREAGAGADVEAAKESLLYAVGVLN